MRQPTVISIGAQPKEFTDTATYFDGQSADAQAARLTIENDAVVIQVDGAVRARWPPADMRRLPDQARRGDLIFCLRDDPLQRLMTNDPLILKRCPSLNARLPVAKRGRLAAWAVAAVSSVAVIIFVLVPVMADQLARVIPPEGERALGEATLGQIREALDDTGFAPVPVCERESGQAALQKIRDRMDFAAPPEFGLTVTVLDHRMVNAFALPGGHVVLFRGLIQASDTPEQLASVLAHEIGHVVSRDPTRHALRSAGSLGVLGLLLGDFAGGTVVLFLAEQLINATYSQTAEAEADRFAHEVMIKAGMDPSEMAGIFETFQTLGGDAEGLVTHFLSHPDLDGRIAAARDARPADLQTTALLTPQEWADLRAICK